MGQIQGFFITQHVMPVKLYFTPFGRKSSWGVLGHSVMIMHTPIHQSMQRVMVANSHLLKSSSGCHLTSKVSRPLVMVPHKQCWRVDIRAKVETNKVDIMALGKQNSLELLTYHSSSHHYHSYHRVIRDTSYLACLPFLFIFVFPLSVAQIVLFSARFPSLFGVRLSLWRLSDGYQ